MMFKPFHVYHATEIETGEQVPLLELSGEIIDSVTRWIMEGRTDPASARSRGTLYGKLRSSTQLDAMEAAGLLLEFLTVRLRQGYVFTKYPEVVSVMDDFYMALCDGISNAEIKWLKRDVDRANRLIEHAENYVHFCVTQLGWLELPGQEDVNNNPSSLSRRVKLIIRERSFLGHIKDKMWRTQSLLGTGIEQGSVQRKIVTRRKAGRSGKIDKAYGKNYPRDIIEEVLFKGCKLDPHSPHYSDVPLIEQYHIRDQLMFALHFFAGLRSSEPLHMWRGDMGIHPKQGFYAFVGEPEISIAPPEIRHEIKISNTIQRAEILWENAHRIPRTKYKKGSGQWVGWKNNWLTAGKDLGMRCVFIPHRPDWVTGDIEAFLANTFVEYRNWMAPRLEEWKKKTGEWHPYLFINDAGGPLTLSGYDKRWKKAHKAIGHSGLKVDAEHRHGCRHDVEARCEEMELSRKGIMAVLHHNSDQSQNAYNRGELSKMLDKIKSGAKNIEQGKVSAYNIADTAYSHKKLDSTGSRTKQFLRNNNA
jgi:hypothetical protein